LAHQVCFGAVHVSPDGFFDGLIEGSRYRDMPEHDFSTLGHEDHFQANPWTMLKYSPYA